MSKNLKIHWAFQPELTNFVTEDIEEGLYDFILFENVNLGVIFVEKTVLCADLQPQMENMCICYYVY